MAGQKLEKYKSFPIIAWATVIAFAIFVGTITIQLKAVTTDLETSTKNLQFALQGDVLETEDIDSLTNSN